jgi:predicted ATPase/class 3 adenylate cyclase
MTESVSSVGLDPDRYLPRELASKLEASRTDRSMQGERRIITMLFCDVKGSTAAAEQLDPEEWTEIINGAFEHMIRPIYKYEGMIPRLMGDAILAFFGAPIAHEDDPQRAVLAGLEIQESIKPYQEEIRKRFGVDFALRVGINTGLVVVGEVGSDLRMEYTAIGDAINLAARMEQTAEPGSVQISEETYKLVAPFFEVEELGGIQVKGKAQPVNAYRVLSVVKTPGQMRGLKGFASTLVGREAELSALEGHLTALSEGTGAVVTVLGEAGLGKSSLVATAHKDLDTTSVSWLEAHALSYTQTTSYYSWRQIIRAAIGARESDSPAKVRSRLQVTSEHAGYPSDEIPFLESMLVVESQESQEKVSHFEGEDLFERITDAVRRFLIKTATESPLVIVFDDLHWMDEASLTLLSNVVKLVQDHSILFLCLMRPEVDTPAWDFNQRLQRELSARSHQIELSPFSSETTRGMLLNLLGSHELPQTLYDQISAKAEGNPFFVEEIIRSLIETEQIVRDNGNWHTAQTQTKISLPKTLSGVLSARIDRLPEAAKHTLHDASVIGRSFDLKTLSALESPTNGLDEKIQKLEHAGLVYIESNGGNPEYAFRHALLHEATYNSILLKRRRKLHTRVGEYLEKTHSDRLNEFAPVLAHHFYNARDARSQKYDEIAGDNAFRLYANSEAVTHFKRALEVALRVEAADTKIEELYRKLGQALELSGRYEEALENYNQLEVYGDEHEVRSIKLTALLAKSTIYSIYNELHDPELSEQALIRALEISEAIGETSIQARLHWNLMLSYLFSNRLDQAQEHGERALPLARESDDRDQLAYILNDLGRVYTCQGKFKQVYEVSKEARQIWGELENENMLADSYGSEAEARFQSGDHQGAQELLKEGLRLSEKTENLWGQSYNRMLISLIHFDKGHIRRGIQISEQCVVEGDQANLLASSIAHRAELGWYYGHYGALEKGFEAAEKALHLADEEQPSFRSFPLAVIVLLHLMKGDSDSAKRIAGREPLQPIPIPYAHYTILVRLANVGLVLAQENYARGLSLVDALLAEVSSLTYVNIPLVLQRKASALAGLNRLDEAHRTLTQACSQAEEMESRHHLWSVYLDLADMNVRLDHREKAEAFRQKAREIIDEIAEDLREISLRESFLAKPRVRNLMKD